MSEFLKFLDEKVSSFPMHIEIGYNKTCDWCIYIYKKDCASNYPNSKHNGQDAIICDVQHCDIELAFAKAQCEVKEWFSENCGGY